MLYVNIDRNFVITKIGTGSISIKQARISRQINSHFLDADIL